MSKGEESNCPSPPESMPKQLRPDDFGYGWSREKLLCYCVQCGVTSTLGYLELLQESKLSRRNSKLENMMLKSIKRAVEQVDELYKIIREKDRSRTP